MEPTSEDQAMNRAADIALGLIDREDRQTLSAIVALVQAYLAQ